ncbi:hypothetical protein A3K01_00155 [candidate division WWE3 bacterium RIFOXYD1_FULL_43_17]|uniref:HIT domain-containing protein n=3 Tax=Katanobacteria TaxID=422282 RepID=A0A1F4XCC1_UNCKA|nr:MAG: Histidine triad (HIT) protein [candidate division WWE3 bacterium GW2011_GWE1_41_27]KKS60703.1 MAG: Histidine triad (HIT) protein [candidate division WWE3 bacterium GW2011_GWF2_42_42]OGC79201.1 MAG: hypothetical protein A3K01_00155 [candidate division WWE3 bacterium RIFOXYD1_FULL_43_17]
MTDCIFCKIAAREIPSEIIYEDETHVAFLDINPTTEGMTVVVTKEHYDSDFYSNNNEIVTAAITAAQNIAELLKVKLGCERVLTRIEGLEVNHLHIKLYPFYTNPGIPSVEEIKEIADKIRS